MASYLVEVYLPRLRAAELADATARAGVAAAQLTHEGTSIRHLRSIYVPEDETCFHFFEGADADVVREASRRAALRYARVVEAVGWNSADSRKGSEMSTFTRITGVIRRLGLSVAVAAVVAALLAPGAQAVPCPQSVALAPTMQDCATIGQLKEPSGFATARVTPTATGDEFDWADAGLGAGVSSGTILLVLTGVMLLQRRVGRIEPRI